MKLILVVALLLVAVTTSTEGVRKYQQKRQTITDVNELCVGIRCPDGKVCRVVEKCSKKRKSQAKCLPCVPEGVDDICNANQFERAVLVGPSSCHLHGAPGPDKFECPEGSECVVNPDSYGHGVCCYGRQVGQVGPSSNADKVCSKCKPECKEGHGCVEDVVCGQLKHVCSPQEKKGMCPVYAMPENYVCSQEDQRSQCDHDQDCGGSQKCCLNGCDGHTCTQVNIVY